MIIKVNIGDGAMYLENGLLHNINDPAWIHEDGTVEYYTNGKLDRKNGPARILPNGNNEYWFDGVYQGVEQGNVFYPWRLL